MKICHSKDDWFWMNFKHERLPNFCFICGILRHSEKFCERLFDEPMGIITKHYGLLKALDRRPVKQIGAKWLKNGMTQSGSGSASGGATTGNERTRENQSVPINVDAVMENVISQGENHGDRVGGVKDNSANILAGNLTILIRKIQKMAMWQVPNLRPAKDYESFKLELSWAWELTGRPIPSGNDFLKASQCCFFVLDFK